MRENPAIFRTSYDVLGIGCFICPTDPFLSLILAYSSPTSTAMLITNKYKTKKIKEYDVWNQLKTA